MTSAKDNLPTIALVASGVLLAYWPVITGLVDAWSTDDNYSHGFFIVPLAAYFAWERRAQFARAPARPSLAGLAVVVLSLMMLVAGTLGAELFLSRVSLIGVTAGAVLFLGGWQRLRVLLFPLAFLLLMMPLPAIIFNQIAFPLQLLASHVGEYAVSSLEIPILREGNVLILANATLEVAEACSGIRSLVSLLHPGHRLWLLRRPPLVGARVHRLVGDPGRHSRQRPAGRQCRRRRAQLRYRRRRRPVPRVLGLGRLRHRVPDDAGAAAPGPALRAAAGRRRRVPHEWHPAYAPSPCSAAWLATAVVHGERPSSRKCPSAARSSPRSR